MPERYFVTGIGTDIGKTIVSAILVEKLGADYWKPIQSGDLSYSDTIKVQNLVSKSKLIFHPEAYRLSEPLSPHLSAQIDGIQINIDDIKIPLTSNKLIIEGAGGLMVPLNQKSLVLDLIKHLKVAVIVVSKNYLGSINHTLLTLNTLRQFEIPIKGIIFSGDHNNASEDYILNYTKVNLLGRIPLLTAINKQTIKEAGQHLSL